MQSLLDVVQSVEWRKLPVADFGVTAVAGELKKILLVAVVKVTETLAADGRRTAKEAIGFEMAAKTEGHGASQKSAIRFSRKAKAGIASGRRYTFGKVKQCASGE